MKFVSCNVSKGVPKKILLQPPTSEPATVMQVSSQIAQSVITAQQPVPFYSSVALEISIVSPSFNSGPSSKPTNSQTAHLNEKSPVHGPVHSPVHSPQSRFCSVPVLLHT